MKLNRYCNAKQFYDQVKDYLLCQEAQHCLLLGISDTTDLANPISNHIYRKIGYLPVTDCCEYKIIN